MRLRKKLCVIGGEMCDVCYIGNFVETDYENRSYEYAKCATCCMDTVLPLYYERIHYFQCDYPYCGYVEDYSIPRYIEDAYPCWFCGKDEEDED